MLWLHVWRNWFQNLGGMAKVRDWCGAYGGGCVCQLGLSFLGAAVTPHGVSGLMSQAQRDRMNGVLGKGSMSRWRMRGRRETAEVGKS
jgi:hypothetical protein